MGAAARSNNFDLLRLLLAVSVALYHVGVLSKDFPAFAAIPAWGAVQAFFVISGYLVTQSYISSRTIKNYFEKRARRVLPAYVTVVIGAVILGTLITTAPAEEFMPGVMRYLAANLAFLNFLAPTIPGVFDGQPINGALWTIKIEVGFYILLPLIIAFLRSVGVLLGSAIIYACALVWSFTFEALGYPTLSYQLPGQMAYFIVGVLLAMIPLTARLQVWVTCIATLAYLIFGDVARPLALGTATILFATGLPHIRAGLQHVGDLSYGVYVYHFPTIQLLIYLGAFAVDPVLAAASAMALTLCLALLSWRYIEKPFLTKRQTPYLRFRRNTAP